ncbi:unnamed protein product [Boreogadus saida]
MVLLLADGKPVCAHSRPIGCQSPLLPLPCAAAQEYRTAPALCCGPQSTVRPLPCAAGPQAEPSDPARRL